jgi:phytoene dehydrogenase-like protein
LAAGIILADAGWKVLILESQPKPGGCVRTAEVTLPGFRHDLYATNLNSFVDSAFALKYGPELARHGFALVRAPSAFCSVFPDGDFVGVTNTLRETLESLAALSPADAAEWERIAAYYRRLAPHLAAMIRQPMPSWCATRSALRCMTSALPLVLGSSGAFVRKHFSNPKIQTLWSTWGMHLDFSPDTPGGALYPLLQCMTIQEKGLHFAKGGAQSMIDAMVDLFRKKGGHLLCSCHVSEIIVENGVATGVINGRERLVARACVIANLTPTVLARLLHGRSVQRVRKKMQRYRYGPGTMMIHLALSALPNWASRRAADFAYIHVAPSLEAISRAYRDAAAGALPDHPVLIVAQPSLADPSRAPAGCHVLSVQVRVVPSAMDWKALKERYADHIVALLEHYAPGLRQLVLARHVLTPLDLERANPNLAGGDSLGGSHRLSQQFILRPFLGWSRYRTPISRLFLCGSATWPGAGLGAGSGWILGQLLTRNRGGRESQFP